MTLDDLRRAQIQAEAEHRAHNRIYGVRLAVGPDAGLDEHASVLHRAIDELLGHCEDHHVAVLWPSVRIRVEPEKFGNVVVADLLGQEES